MQEDASRTDIRFLIQFAAMAKDMGHPGSGLRTLGYENPFSIYENCNLIAKEIGIPIGIHCHGDLGMAVPIPWPERWV
jgi:homocitrate synthase NifV